MKHDTLMRLGFTVGHDGCNIISRRTSLPIARHHHAALAALDVHRRNSYIKVVPEDVVVNMFEGCPETHWTGDPYCEGCWGIVTATSILGAAEEGDIDE